ncbi:MAG: DNA ligase (NAD(+)) LigA, partial [Spirochaetales bacterium]|nr:DNA ligase (NAD(+)) LigA [Spirochaetales bacterium]
AFFLSWPGQPLPSGPLEALASLKALGFPVNAPVAALSPDGQFTPVQRHALEMLNCRGVSYATLAPLVEEQTLQRPTLDWDIDGLVFKVDALALREELGATEHHPRWAVAYKFESPQGETKVEEITVQVGRTGRVTPVARVAPVVVGGSTITFVTLHNQGFIEGLELNIGDVVSISRRGDVIPAVERVVEKLTPGTWQFPDFCPACGSCLRKEGAHAFCPQPDCPDQKRFRLIFFAGKDQMDIENLGPETVDTLISLGLVNDPADFFTCDYDKLLDVPGFGPKKVDLIRAGVEKARKQPFVRVLTSLGIPDLGPKLAQLLIESGLKNYLALRDALENRAEELINLPGVGERTVESLKLGLLKPSVNRLIEKLTRAGLVMEAQSPRGPENTAFAGTVWCVTGSFEKFQPRALAEEEILKRSGRVVSAVSGATTHLLAGSGAGSKLQKAQSLGVSVVSEQDFLTALTQQRIPGQGVSS